MRSGVDLEGGRSASALMTTLSRLTSWCFLNGLVCLSKPIVQEAIKQLQERGEKVTAFVVIAVAKQVLVPLFAKSRALIGDPFPQRFMSGMFHCDLHLN